MHSILISFSFYAEETIKAKNGKNNWKIPWSIRTLDRWQPNPNDDSGYIFVNN